MQDRVPRGRWSKAAHFFPDLPVYLRHDFRALFFARVI